MQNFVAHAVNSDRSCVGFAFAVLHPSSIDNQYYGPASFSRKRQKVLTASCDDMIVEGMYL